MRSAAIAVALGAAVGTVLVGLVLHRSARGTPAAGAVSTDNFTFTPQTVTVRAGTVVTWTRDDIPRGIASTDNAFARSQAWMRTTSVRSPSPRPAPVVISAMSIRT
jgi:plastocyanin